MKKNWLLLFIFFLGGVVSGQEMSPVFSSGNKQVDALSEKARKEMLKNDDNLPAMKLADEAKQVALNENNPLATAKANATFSWIFLDGNNLDAAENFAKKALQNIEGQKFPEADAMLHHQLAIILDKKGEPKTALQNYLKAIKNYEDSKNT